MQIQLRMLGILFSIVAACATAYGQQDTSPGYVFHPNQEARIQSFPTIVADSSADSDVLSASVASAVNSPDVCCGRNSALVDPLASISGFSLKDLGRKLRGKHYFDSGLSFTVTDQYWPGGSVNAESIIGTLRAQRPLLTLWNGHLYVMYGAVFGEYLYNDGASTHTIQKLLLVDTRFSDDRRYVTFDRQTDDWSKVTGLLSLAITR